MSNDSGVRVLSWTHGPPPRKGISSAEQLAEFQSVYEDCFPFVLRYMLARVGDRSLAEDLTADVFEAAVRAWPGFERRSTPRTWVLGIANHVLSHHWRRARTQFLPLDTISPSRLQEAGATPEEELQQRSDAENLRRAISCLSEEEGELLALRYAADLSFREIATLTGTREVTLRVRMHRTLRRLRNALKAAGMAEP